MREKVLFLGQEAALLPAAISLSSVSKVADAIYNLRVISEERVKRQTRVPRGMKTGSEVLDKLINCLEGGIITTIYGPSSSGKTCLCLQAAAEIIKEKKVMYIDTEGGFSPERIQQLVNVAWDNIILFSPTTFEEQNRVIAQLKSIMNDRIGLIIVDSIAMLYRLEMHKNEDIQAVNRQLALQLAALTEIARKYQLPVLITNQVYARFDERNTIKMVGGELVRYSSKCVIELQKNEKQRKAVLQKHRSLPEGIEINFEIQQQGTSIIS